MVRELAKTVCSEGAMPQTAGVSDRPRQGTEQQGRPSGQDGQRATQWNPADGSPRWSARWSMDGEHGDGEGRKAESSPSRRSTTTTTTYGW